MLNKIDDYVRDKIFQSFSHWLQKSTGLTNFWLARWACFIFIITIMFLAIMLSIVTGFFSVYSFFFCFVSIVVSIISFQDIIDLKKKDVELNKCGYCFVGKRRIYAKKNRIYCVGVAAFFIPLFIFGLFRSNNLLVEMFIFLWVILGVSFIFSLYFEDCIPLHPLSNGKINECNER